MNSKATEITATTGESYTCLVLEATHPRSGLPCVYATFLAGEEELGGVHFCFPVVYLLSVPFDWPKILARTIEQIQAERWLDQVIGSPGLSLEAIYQVE